MAKSKTGAFYLTEQVILTATDTAVQGTISLSSYVDVASKQGIAIESVDFLYQGVLNGVYTNSVNGIHGAGTVWTASAQVTDNNRGVNIVSAADRALVGSGALNSGLTDDLSHYADIYPDSYGPVAFEQQRTVVNDTLYFTADTGGNFAAADNMAVTVRLTCRIIGLSTKDFMAIALTGSAADA